MTMTHIPDDLGDPRIEHRFLGMDRRLIAPTLAILGLIIFWAGVIPAINEATEGDPLDPDTPLTVAEAVEFTPAEGWRPSAAPVPSNSTLELFKDGTVFIVSPGAWDGTADELLDELEDEFNPTVTGDRAEFTLPSGLSGIGIDTTAYDEIGFLVALISDERFSAVDDRATGIRVEASSEIDFDAADQEDIAEMLSSMRVIPYDERDVTADDEEDEG